MAETAERPVSQLSYGDVKRVELAIALASAPKLLLMDEPTAGMAPSERSALMSLVAKLARERSIGVLFTEHDMDAVFAHATSVLVLVRGEIVARGNAGGCARRSDRAAGLSRRGQPHPTPGWQGAGQCLMRRPRGPNPRPQRCWRYAA